MSRFQHAVWLTVAGIVLLPSCATVERRLLRVQSPESRVHRRESRDPGRADDPGVTSPQRRSNDRVIVLTTGQTGDGKHDVLLPVPLAPPASDADNPDDVPTRLPVEPPASGMLLTLETLEQWAYENNPTLQQSISVLDKARGIQRQVGMYPNPVAGYSASEIGNEGNAGQQGGFISQTIVTGGKLRLNREVADWDIENLSWEFQAQRYRVQNDVRLRFYAVLGAQRRVKIATELLKVAQEGVRAAKALLEGKQGTRPDVLQAQVQLNRVRITLQNARYDSKFSWKQLAAVIGRPELNITPLSGDLFGDPQEWGWETTYQKLLAGSPELQAAQARTQRALAQLQRQEIQPVPNLLAQVGVAKDASTGSTIANVQIGIPLPIFNRNQGNIDLAHAEYHRAVSDVERLQLALRNRLAVAFRDFQQSRQQVQRYGKDIIPTAKENLNLTEEGYKQGEFDFIRVLTARRTFFEVSLNYVDSLVALKQSSVILSGLLLTGGLNDVRNISQGVGGVSNRGRALSGQ